MHGEQYINAHFANRPQSYCTIDNTFHAVQLFTRHNWNGKLRNQHSAEVYRKSSSTLLESRKLEVEMHEGNVWGDEFALIIYKNVITPPVLREINIFMNNQGKSYMLQTWFF